MGCKKYFQYVVNCRRYLAQNNFSNGTQFCVLKGVLLRNEKHLQGRVSKRTYICMRVSDKCIKLFMYFYQIKIIKYKIE